MCQRMSEWCVEPFRKTYLVYMDKKENKYTNMGRFPDDIFYFVHISKIKH